MGKDFTDYASASLPDGTKAELGGFDGLTDYESDLTARLKFSGTLGSATGKRLILPGLLFEARGKHPFVAEESRSVAVDLHYATMELDEATYHFPAGVKADELPARRSLEWASRIGLNIEVTPAEGAVTVKRMFVRTATLVDPSYYNNLRAIYQQISSADQQQMVLSRVTEAGTN